MFAAIQYAKSGLAGTAVNPVRFCWWGAEEIGLLGARYYVANLTEQEAQHHLLYLNYDMLGSPNFVIQVRATRPVRGCEFWTRSPCLTLNRVPLVLLTPCAGA